MNLGQLRAAVDRRTGIAIDPAGAADFVNEANRTIAADHDWPWLATSKSFSTIAGTGSYSGTDAIPADWLRTISLRVADEVPMGHLSVNALDDAWPSADSTGTPYQYSVHAGALLLRPIPDSVLTVTHRYFRAEPELVQDSDVPLMPALFHTAIAELAAAIVLRRARESVRAAECTAAYERWARRMLDDVRRHAGPVKVRLRGRR